jgi:hypothetical protein
MLRGFVKIDRSNVSFAQFNESNTIRLKYYTPKAAFATLAANSPLAYFAA